MNSGQAVLRIPEVAPEMKAVEISRDSVVVGDHPAVLVMADALSSMGISVTLIHPFGDIDELLSPVRALMEADAEVLKGYELLCGKITASPAVTVLNESAIEEASGWWGQFTLKVRKDGTASTLKTSGLAMAFQGKPSLPEGLPTEYVVTFSEFLRRFDPRKAALRETAKAVGRVAFLLDVETRDEKWPSVAALRFGAFLREFGTQVYILCKDLKVSVDGMEKEYRRARESGILIFKYEALPQVEENGGRYRLVFKDASAVRDENPLEVVQENLDAVVVQEKILPSETQKRLLEQLRISQEEGFVGPNNPQFVGRTSKKGVVVGGDTWYPEYPTDGVTTALSAVEELGKWVGAGTYQVDVQRVAEVDPSKCATCLTCYRICPHDSIRVERYGERNVYITKGEKEGATWEAARIKVETCNGCGLCASECPAKAIQLVYYPDLEVLEFLEKH